jgi:hypothetical protein
MSGGDESNVTNITTIESEGTENSPPLEGWQAKPDGVVTTSLGKRMGEFHSPRTLLTNRSLVMRFAHIFKPTPALTSLAKRGLKHFRVFGA